MQRDLSATSGRLALIAAVLAVALATVTLTPRMAQACGGFFCDNSLPVNQAAERIIFVDDGDGTVTAVVQILYEGPSDRFAWVLPVPSVPDIGVSSNVAFQRLQAASNPRYILQTDFDGDCVVANASPSAGGIPDDEFDAGSGVTVEASGSVGPYLWSVISVAADREDPAADAIDWLTENDYDLTAVGPDLLRPYLEMGMMLVAFRLESDADAGEIRPVTMTYSADTPMIPIKLTAVAANEDMGVMVWVVAEERAVPVNYRSLVLNEAAINWLNPNSNYADVINLAADEAGGQGFVTEMAGSSETFADVIWAAWEAENFETNFEGQRGSWVEDPVALLEMAINNYGGFDGFAESLDDIVVLPEGISLEDAINCFRCYDVEMASLARYDTNAFIDALALNVVDPMAETQALVDSGSYVTRLFTTLSAAEMTLDPVFDYNPDLGDYSNVHTATRVMHCSDDVQGVDLPWTLELPQGGTIVGRGATWPFVVGDDMPANLQVVQASTSGPSQVVQDNTRTVNQALRVNNDVVGAGDEMGCGCRSVDVGSASPVGLVLLGWALLGRRRRRRV